MSLNAVQAKQAIENSVGKKDKKEFKCHTTTQTKSKKHYEIYIFKKLFGFLTHIRYTYWRLSIFNIIRTDIYTEYTSTE
jgi:hypothetical protein